MPDHILPPGDPVPSITLADFEESLQAKCERRASQVDDAVTIAAAVVEHLAASGALVELHRQHAKLKQAETRLRATMDSFRREWDGWLATAQAIANRFEPVGDGHLAEEIRANLTDVVLDDVAWALEEWSQPGEER